MNSDEMFSKSEDSASLLDQLQVLGRKDAGLERTIEALLSHEDGRGGALATLIAGRSTIANQRLLVLARCALLLSQRVSELEARLGSLTGEVRDHDASIRMLIHLLRDLDDPYGLGLSLDERIAGDGDDLTINDPEG